MENSFDPIAYLNGLTRFVFDKDALVNIAYKNGLMSILDSSEVSESMEDHCYICLFKLVIHGASHSSSLSIQHGSYRKDFGTDIVDKYTKEELKKEVDRLHIKYGEKTEYDGGMQWVDENSLYV